MTFQTVWTKFTLTSLDPSTGTPTENDLAYYHLCSLRNTVHPKAQYDTLVENLPN